MHYICIQRNTKLTAADVIEKTLESQQVWYTIFLGVDQLTIEPL